MAQQIIVVNQDVWNLRGSFRIGGVVNIGTQASLVRRRSGGFVLLDSLELEPDILARVHAATDGGRAVEWVINLHPFHTVHLEAMHRQFPQARWVGHTRHVARAPGIPWDPLRVDAPALQAELAPDLELSVPAGVDLVCANEAIHFGSVLALHQASGTLHVDDTLTFSRLPFVGGLSFHPTLSQALQQRPRAAADFRAWAEGLASGCNGVHNVLAAHLAPLLGDGDVPGRVRNALERVAGVLAKHEKRWG